MILLLRQRPYFIINDIGIPGAIGYGVGICPKRTPTGYTALPNTFVLGSDNYGNYLYSDNSVMVWIPAFYVRIGHVDNPTYATYGVNSIHTQPIRAFSSVAVAESAGYFLPRAFIDGGDQLPGFMIDKYECSNNSGTASSIKNGNPLSCHTDHNPFSGLTGSPANNMSGAFSATKTRGTQFFPASLFQHTVLAILAMAHGQAATSTTYCAWYDSGGTTNFPKGNNNDALGDINDGSVSYVSDGYSNCGQTGSGTPFARTTHNGQNCGIADLNGNMREINIGLTCIATTLAITNATQTNPVQLTVVGHGLVTGKLGQVNNIVGMTELNGRIYTITVIDPDTISLDGADGTGFTAYTSGGNFTKGTFYVAKETTQMEDFTGGNTLATDHWGATGIAAMTDPITLPFRTDYPNNAFALRCGNGANQVWDDSLASGKGLGIPLSDGCSSSGTNLFGLDILHRYYSSDIVARESGAWDSMTGSGVWTRYLQEGRISPSVDTGVRAASYPVTI